MDPGIPPGGLHPRDCARLPSATKIFPDKAEDRISLGISLSPRSSHVRLCLRSSVKEIIAINTSTPREDRLRSVSWYRGNYPGLVIVLSGMVRLRRRRFRKKAPSPAVRSTANPGERRDLSPDQSDLNTGTAGKIADAGYRIPTIRNAEVFMGISRDAPGRSIRKKLVPGHH